MPETDDEAWYRGDRSAHLFHRSTVKASFRLDHRVRVPVNASAYRVVDDDEAMAPVLIEAKELADFEVTGPVAGKDLVEEIVSGAEIVRTALAVAVQISRVVPSRFAEKVPVEVLVLNPVDRILVR